MAYSFGADSNLNKDITLGLGYAYSTTKQATYGARAEKKISTNNVKTHAFFA